MFGHHGHGRIRVAIAYKNFAAYKGISHIGLGISATNNAQALERRGIPAFVIPAETNVDIVRAMREYNYKHPGAPLTHVVVCAPWLSARDVHALCEHFHRTHFAIVSHSNVGFLQADPSGIHLIRQYLSLAQELPNLSVAGNSERFVRWLSSAYGARVECLPNMYDFESPSWRRDVIGDARRRGFLRIGDFGAVRPQKNLVTAVAAGLVLRRLLDLPVEFLYSSGREEGGATTLLSAMRQLSAHVHGFALVPVPWRPWDQFREVVASCDLLAQLSYTESFNMVTADGVATGVASVVSSSIAWAPASWKADYDDAEAAARTAKALLESRHQRAKGERALRTHTRHAAESWLGYLVRTAITHCD